MTLKVPDFKEGGLTKFLINLIADMDDKNDEKISKIAANHSVLLQSPGNKVYEITVNDAGVLVITKVQG